MKIRSIRAKLLISCLIFLTITIGIVVLSLWLNSRKDSIQTISLLLAQTNLEIQRAKRVESDFLKDDVISPEYYGTGKSTYLEERAKILKKVNKNLKLLRSHYEIHKTSIAQNIDRLTRLFQHYEHDFQQILALALKRGFKNFGKEGEMRESIHILESNVEKYRLDLAKMLTIRRIEKDFILRKEWHYTEDIKKAIRIFQDDINSKVKDQKQNQYLSTLLQNYDTLFSQVATLERTIGFTQKMGLRKELDDSSLQIEAIIQKLNQEISNKTNTLATQSYGTFISGISVALVILVLFTIYTTRTLGAPISNLSESIHTVIGHNFSKEIDFELIKSRDEIGQLSRDFAYMLGRVQQNMEELRTQAENIARKQQALMESINYAKKIQSAILPESEDFEQYFASHFVMYIPMHTVSGDFYWLAEIDQKVFIAVIDCTGHGVPGAIMSMIGNTLLNKILKEHHLLDPSFILAMLDLEVRLALRQDQEKNDDGMDIAFCMLEGLVSKQEMIKITFSGAKGKLIYTEKGEVKRLDGSRRSIGGKGKAKHELETFENFEIYLAQGERLYLSSDGYSDQPSISRKKFGVKNFIALLQENTHLSLNDQNTLLQKTLEDHVQNLSERRDDITVVGVEL
jgi:serine phosphatase RsbU (regulator of sigma subunit)